MHGLTLAINVMVCVGVTIASTYQPTYPSQDDDGNIYPMGSVDDGQVSGYMGPMMDDQTPIGFPSQVAPVFPGMVRNSQVAPVYPGLVRKSQIAIKYPGIVRKGFVATVLPRYVKNGYPSVRPVVNPFVRQGQVGNTFVRTGLSRVVRHQGAALHPTLHQKVAYPVTGRRYKRSTGTYRQDRYDSINRFPGVYTRYTRFPRRYPSYPSYPSAGGY
ncbi:uncharacterized protein LOC117334462 [Pecten maximus]|uniref:uncharacterized protein LOC117334462 n=1 Tax=Pecten maximus TaxID=6579 RepID=UPI001458E058|nr:uncharacterized protein LOC117334462 [Pecten maximus]